MARDMNWRVLNEQLVHPQAKVRKTPKTVINDSNDGAESLKTKKVG